METLLQSVEDFTGRAGMRIMHVYQSPCVYCINAKQRVRRRATSRESGIRKTLVSQET